MYRDKKILAIIPARSGSKGLSDKNVKDLNGKPLIAYTICAAIKSEVFDYIMVSTDSEKYAEISRCYGASVPFLRSSRTSSDSASTIEVIVEVLDKLDKKYDIVIILQPTSPLRASNDIIESLDLFFEKKAKAVVGVTKLNHPLELVNHLPEDKSMDGFIKKEHINKSRQEIDSSYVINGAIYIINTNLISKDLNLYQKGTFAYIMNEENSIDIDTELDFTVAESILIKKMN